MPDPNKVIEGRKAVDAYRTTHTQLYGGGWHKGIPEEHTPLLETMLADLKKQGFNSLDEFFSASEELNVQELGFATTEDFLKNHTEADEEASRLQWK